MIETWRPVQSFEDRYQVSNLGRVRSLMHHAGKRGVPKILRPGISRTGVCLVILARDGTRAHKFVHHLVLEAFIGARPVGTECCHFNDDRTDNRLSNLRWDTKKANALDKRRNGKTPMGENHHGAKITESIVEEILSSKEPNVQLASRLGVSYAIVYRVRKGQTWQG